ncbi:MAG: hypothetical protein KDC95_20125 [Planctomycetes bacterium]|nr:hypothetical protein [Planctomycetota bacterium]
MLRRLRTTLRRFAARSERSLTVLLLLETRGFALGAHDDVRDVRIVLRNNALNKTFIADNLEFSEWVLKP